MNNNVDNQSHFLYYKPHEILASRLVYPFEEPNVRCERTSIKERKHKKVSMANVIIM